MVVYDIVNNIKGMKHEIMSHKFYSYLSPEKL